MSPKTEPLNSRGDGIRWLIVWLLVAGTIFANIYFSSQSVTIRAIGAAILAAVIIAVTSFTVKGKKFWAFVGETKIELRKVVWPTRQETIQATLMIIVVVVLASLFLWGIDSILLWLISLFTGQRG